MCVLLCYFYYSRIDKRGNVDLISWLILGQSGFFLPLTVWQILKSFTWKLVF